MKVAYIDHRGVEELTSKLRSEGIDVDSHIDLDKFLEIYDMKNYSVCLIHAGIFHQAELRSIKTQNHNIPVVIVGTDISNNPPECFDRADYKEITNYLKKEF